MVKIRDLFSGLGNFIDYKSSTELNKSLTYFLLQNTKDGIFENIFFYVQQKKVNIQTS